MNEFTMGAETEVGWILSSTLPESTAGIALGRNLSVPLESWIPHLGAHQGSKDALGILPWHSMAAPCPVCL